MSLRCLLPIVVVGAAVSACATAPDADKVDVASCNNKETLTGSRIVRRDQCIEGTAQSREDARRRGEILREDQNRRNMPKPGAGMPG